jgi:hypothetical protein
MRRPLAVARRTGLLLAVAGLLTLSVPASRPAEAHPNPAGAGSAHDGYYWIDYFRALGGLGPVARDPGMEAQEARHVRYLADHALSCETDVHDELTSPRAGCGANPYATAAGKLAANNSDVTRVNAAIDDRIAVRNWFVAGFHALTLLDPRLRSTGYAAYYTATPTGAGSLPYQFTAAVDVYRGRTGGYAGQRLSFPAIGTTSPLLAYRVGTESPDPFGSTLAGAPCHAWADLDVVSAPIVVQWPVAARPLQAPAVIVDETSGRTLRTCALTAAAYPAGSLGRTFLLGTNRATQAALYYADTPFQSGHRYQLRIGAAVVTAFRTSG